jgi:hypothetical protein
MKNEREDSPNNNFELIIIEEDENINEKLYIPTNNFRNYIR